MKLPAKIGILMTECGRVDEAVPLSLLSLGTRLKLRVPQIHVDLHWLGRQREALGDERFGELIDEHLGSDKAEEVLALMRHFEEARESEQLSENPAGIP